MQFNLDKTVNIGEVGFLDALAPAIKSKLSSKILKYVINSA